MEIVFIIGTILLLISIILNILIVVMACYRLRSAKTKDFLEEYYKEEFGDKP